MDKNAKGTQGLAGDRIVAATLAMSYVAGLAIGAEFQSLTLAAVGGGIICGLGLLGWRAAPGTSASSIVLGCSQMAMVALHIQLGRGTTEFHFGVFVTLGLLLLYMDWRPIVAAATLAAVHHLVFDRLQALGWEVYCTTAASFMRVLQHATYVVVQTGVEVYVALWMQGMARQARNAAAEREQALDRLRQAIQATQQSVASIELASGEIASGNSDLSGRTEQTAGQLKHATDSMEQLSQAVHESAESAVSASRLAVSTAAAAERGGGMVSEVVAKMDDITASSRQISDIIGVIDGIAFQTNILALNAAVEAARAGDQGRGFAVVAAEVRALAMRSAEAARQIKTLISTSVGNVEAGSRLVHEAGSTMTEIVAGVRNVASLIDRVSGSAASQSSDIVSVKATVSEIERMTQQNAALVEQSAAASDSLRQQAGQLAQAMTALQRA